MTKEEEVVGGHSEEERMSHNDGADDRGERGLGLKYRDSSTAASLHPREQQREKKEREKRRE